MYHGNRLVHENVMMMDGPWEFCATCGFAGTLLHPKSIGKMDQTWGVKALHSLDCMIYHPRSSWDNPMVLSCRGNRLPADPG